MPKLEWLDGWSGQTVDELIALEGKYRTDSLVLAFEQAIDQKAARVGGENLSVEEFTVLAIEAMEREVNNGGWAQFFVNTGQFAPIIAQALECIGCPKTAKIAQKAVKVFENARITAEEIQNGSWEEINERLGALDRCNDFYFEHPENIEASLFKFISANRTKIKL